VQTREVFHMPAASDTPRVTRFDSEGLAEGLSDYWKIVPRQIPSYWLEGRFNVAQYRSDRYNRLGWSLLVRGIYWYEVTTSEGKVSHGGLAQIDFETDSEDLVLTGLRVIGRDCSHGAATWKSTMCRLDAKAEFASLQFAYSWRMISSADAGTEKTIWPAESIKKVLKLSSAISKKRQDAGSMDNPEKFLDSSEAFDLYNLNTDFASLTNEDLKSEGLKGRQHAMVICGKIKDQPIKGPFILEGEYLPTDSALKGDDAVGHKIKFLRLL
jgi:hypothetical protein